MRMDKVGPPLWRGLHAITFAYPEHAPPSHRHAAAAMFESLAYLLPCDGCSEHYRSELAAHPVAPAVGGREALSRWLVDLHNRVNARLGKAQVGYDAVAAEYLDCTMSCGADAPAAPGDGECCAPQPGPPPPAAATARLERTRGERAAGVSPATAAFVGVAAGLLVGVAVGAAVASCVGVPRVPAS